jgi:membrane-associated phospholipid phosphatase
MSRLQRWWVAFWLASAAIAVGCLLLDRPIAWFAHAYLKSIPVFEPLTYIPEPLPGVATALVFVVGVMILSDRPAARWQRVAVAWSLSILATVVIVRQFKFVFGRTWPETWSQGNPSLVHDNAFGFHFLQPPHGNWYTSFPSGHTAAICAAAAVLWVCYPRLRAVYGLAVAAVVVGLIGSNFHFVSDIIAGGFVGTTVALVALRLAGLSPAKSGMETTRPPEATGAPPLTPPARS